MAAPPAALLNKNKKNFIGMPAPLGYVAGVGRGWERMIFFRVFTFIYFLILLFKVFLFILA